MRKGRECSIGALKAGTVGVAGATLGRSLVGLSLGLSISRKAVAANRGEIHHRNLAGKGCIFTIDLPQAPAFAEARHRSPA